MTAVSTDHTMPASADRVWVALAAFETIDTFHPLVERVTMSSQQPRGLGAIRTCHFYDGTSVDEKVLRWREGEGYEVELSNFSMPLKRAKARIEVHPDGADRSVVRFSMEYTVKWGPLGWVMGQVMMKPMMRGMFAKVLRGLEHHVRTGENVGKDWRPTAAEGLSAVA